MTYREILAEKSGLWCDQYHLVMAQALFAAGLHETETTFHMTVREAPFHGVYFIAAGQNIFFEWLKNFWRFEAEDLNVLQRKTSFNPTTQKDDPLFTPSFLEGLARLQPRLTIEALPEGELAFPDEPILRVRGPVWQCLLVEAALLNCINSQSLFATLASRLDFIAGGAPVLEFGLRRAQSIDGLSATRGAYIGGVSGTSNMLAEKYYQIPAVGTMAHAFVMLFEDELSAFESYARAMPHNGVFLVDTYHTLQGVKNAMAACQKVGTTLKAIRIDSGDLAYLAIESRKLLDAAGFTQTRIILSNDLDEERINQILRVEKAPADDWAVGTRLATSYHQPSLGGIYKLGAVHGAQAPVRDVIKTSNQLSKTTIPGVLDMVRYLDANGRLNGSTILDGVQEAARSVVENGSLARDVVSVYRGDLMQKRVFKAGTRAYKPLQRVFDRGQLLAPLETIHQARARAKESLARLDASYRRLIHPHEYKVGIEQSLSDKRRAMIEAHQA